MAKKGFAQNVASSAVWAAIAAGAVKGIEIMVQTTVEHGGKKVKREFDKKSLPEAIQEVRRFIADLLQTCLNPEIRIGGTDQKPKIVRIKIEDDDGNPVNDDLMVTEDTVRRCQSNLKALEARAKAEGRWYIFWTVLAEGWRSIADDIPRPEPHYHRQHRLLILRLDFEPDKLDEAWQKITLEAKGLSFITKKRAEIQDRWDRRRADDANTNEEPTFFHRWAETVDKSAERDRAAADNL